MQAAWLCVLSVIPAPTSHNPGRAIRAAVYWNLRRLFGRREAAHLKLCFWAQGRACYGWQIKKDSLILRMLDPEQRLEHLPRRNKALIEITHSGPEIAAAAAAVKPLAHQPPALHLKHRNAPGDMRSALLVEMDEGRHSHLLDPYSLEHYQPEDYRQALLDLVFGIEARFFPELSAHLQAISSPVSALPIDGLSAILGKEADATLAYLALPAANVRRTVQSMEEGRRAEILRRAETLPLSAIQDNGLLHKIEKSILTAAGGDPAASGNR